MEGSPNLSHPQPVESRGDITDNLQAEPIPPQSLSPCIHFTHTWCCGLNRCLKQWDISVQAVNVSGIGILLQGVRQKCLCLYVLPFPLFQLASGLSFNLLSPAAQDLAPKLHFLMLFSLQTLYLVNFFPSFL